MISCGRLCNESSVMKFVDCTLMRVQQPYTEVFFIYVVFLFVLCVVC